MSNTHTINEVQRGRPSTKGKDPKRIKRVPMSGSRKRMHIDESELDSNFHYAWINDQKDLIYRAQRAGYEHVTLDEIPGWGTRDVDSANPTASFVSMPVDRDGTQAYFMKQPMEYYEEDRATMDELVDARESDMKKELNSGKDGEYGSVDIARRKQS